MFSHWFSSYFKILTHSCFFETFFYVFSTSESEKNNVKLSLTHQ
jgi:hypothetical protein